MKKIGKVSLILLAAVALAVCANNQNKSGATKSSSKVTKTAKPKKMGHLKANDLSPQKTVAVITAYAGRKYAGDWETALDQAKDKGLEVDLKNQTDFSYMKNGSGVVYLVGKNAGYTLKQVDGKNTYFLYADKKELAAVTMKEMVKYLNQSDSDKLVEKLTKKAKVIDQRSDDSTTNDTSQKSNIPADGGLFTIPAAYRGTWYTYHNHSNKLTIIKIGAHTISLDGYTTELHTVDKHYTGDYIEKYQKVKSYTNATKNWGRPKFWKVNHIKYLNVMGWMQSAGDGEFYGLHTEKGQPVLVIGYGAGLWTDSVAWRTQNLAKQYKHQKFADLGYQDGE
ncbi:MULTISPECIES: hypothetical protein [Lactobacillus]|uniref:hypothetical protein n=1 Tax=Lactobacillus TaxID=1578 RepID=UPI00191C586F|nr:MULTISPECIES: hypothetical protein [Lactobacillus]